MISILANNTTYLDLLPKEYIALSYQVFDLAQPDTRQGTFSIDFDIPNTAHNREALGFATIQNIVNSDFRPSTKIPAKAYQNNILISDGFIKIVESLPSVIKITFYGENIDVWESIRGKKLKDLDLRELRHAYTAANIIDSFSNTSGYIYNVIDQGLFTNRSSLTIKSREIYPSIFIDDLVKGIFKDAGLKVAGTLLERSLYKKSVVPFVNSEFGFSQEFVDSKSFFARNFGPVDPTWSSGVLSRYNFSETLNFFLGKTYTNGLFNVSSDRYTADDDYQIQVTFSHDLRGFRLLNGDVARPTLYIYKNGSLLATSPTNTAGVQVNVTVTSGDYLEFFVLNNHSSSVKIRANAKGIVSREIIEGSIVFPEIVLPDITQVDFIKWLLFRFSGVIEVDTFTKTVYINQFNDLRNNPVDDWSSKVDLSKEVRTDFVSPVKNLAKRNIASYILDENDVYQKEFKADNDISFGSGVIELENDFLEDEKVIYEAPFSGTFLIQSFADYKLLIPYFPRHLLDDGVQKFETEHTSDSGGLLQLSLQNAPNFSVGDYVQINDATENSYNGVWKIEEKVDDTTFTIEKSFLTTSNGKIIFFNPEVNPPEPRVLTVYGLLDLAQISEAESLTILGTEVTQIPFCYFYKSTYGFEVDDFKESLAFGAQNIFAPNDLGAFDSDYTQLIRVFENPEMKDVYLKLNQLDITNLEFLQKKYIERLGGYFYLNLIDEYDGTGDSVLCELIKL